jgi:hypothetical protein
MLQASIVEGREARYRGPIPNAPHAYEDSLVVEKAHSKRAVVVDRDGTIQSGRNPPYSELLARHQLRMLCSTYVFGASTAQTPELGMEFETYERSVELGFNRMPARFLIDDNNSLRTSNLEGLRELCNLQDMDFINSFGVGLTLLQKNGGYINDSAYANALGGQRWCERALLALKRVDPKHDHETNLAPINKKGRYEAGEVSVEELPFRLQWDFTEDELEKREQLHFAVMQAHLKGELLDAVIVDESNLGKRRYTSYLVPKLGRKERALGRLFHQIKVHSGVALEDFEKIALAGDTLTDLQSGLYGLPGARTVAFILAAGSRLSEPLYSGELRYAGMPLLWNRAHPTLVPRFETTNVEGVFRFRAHRFMPWRTVILADYFEPSRKMGCAESVVTCLEYLGF